MKEIRLSQNKIALVDDGDFNYINQWKWYAENRGYGFYARTMIGRKNFYMHRFILDVFEKNIIIDHKDRNPLNNQRDNIRIANTSQNLFNKSAHKDGKSKFLGVCWDSERQKWMAAIGYDNKQHFLGRYNSEIEAAKAYDLAAIEHHKEFANPNFK